MQKQIIKNTVPKDRHIDILLSHDAPYGCSDQCFESMTPNDHIGSYVIRETIKKYKPTYCIHGHLHTSNHNEEILYDTKVYNVSILDEEYRISFNPLYFEINK
jgi:Icc-related predicted phosphoesterase